MLWHIEDLACGGDADFDDPVIRLTSAPDAIPEHGVRALFKDVGESLIWVGRVDANVDYDWGAAGPDPEVGGDSFMAEWHGLVEAEYNETYTFYTNSSGPVDLYIDGQKLIDNSTEHTATENSGSITLEAGQKYDLWMHYSDSSGDAALQLSWSSPSTPKQVIPTERLYPNLEIEGTVPQAPTDLAAVAIASSQVSLSWGDGSSDESGFSIERKTGASGAWQEIGAVPANTTSYLDSGLVDGTTYVYRIRAVNLAGNSDYTSEVSATPSAAANGLFGHWLFDEGNGTVAGDASPAGNAGTLVNGITWTGRAGGSALNLDGVNDYVQLTSDLSPVLGNTASVTAWIKTEQMGDETPTVGLLGNQAAGTNDIAWGWIDSSGRIGVQAGDGEAAKSRSPINDNLWHHVAMTRNDATGKVEIYIDGVLNASAVSETGSKSSLIDSIGRLLNGQFLQGQIDEVRVYGYILTAGEVAGIATSTAPAPVAPSDLSAIPADSEIGPFAQVDLAWTNNSEDATTFEIERSEDGVNFTQIAIANIGATSYSDTGLIPGTTYTYRVRAVGLGGTSAYSDTASAEAAGTGLLATYYDNKEFTGKTMTRVDPIVDFAWSVYSVSSSIAGNTFSVRWEGQVKPEFDEEYTFYSNSDDGVRLWVDNQLLIDNWTAHTGEDSGTINLQAGHLYDIRLEYYEEGWDATQQLSWSSASQVREVIPQERLYAPATAFAATPTTPTGLTASVASASQIDLNWSDTSADEDGFRIERSTDGINFVQIGEVPADINYFNDSGLDAQTSYQYRVRAYRQGENSDYSATAACSTSTDEGITYVSDLSPTSATNGDGPVEKDRTNGRTQPEDGDPIRLGGTLIRFGGAIYPKGLGVAAPSDIDYDLGGAYSHFLATVGIDERSDGDGAALFQVWGDGVKLFDSGVMTGTSSPQLVDVNVAGVQQLTLTVTEGEPSDWHYAVWAGARLTSGVDQAPATPSGLTAIAISGSEIELAWTDNSADEFGFQIERSEDGTNFEQIATVGTGITHFTDVELAAGQTYSYRVRAYTSAGQSAYGATASATISTTLPAPWQSKDIGRIYVTGDADYSGGVFTLQSTGEDIGDTADAFRFAYQALSGDGEIVAHVASLEYTGDFAQAGVMMRASLAPDATHASMFIVPADVGMFQRRLTTGGDTTTSNNFSPSAPIWLKLTRSGDTFTGYLSNDGITWTLVGSDTVAMGETIYVGLALSSAEPEQVNTTTFDNVSVNGNVSLVSADSTWKYLDNGTNQGTAWRQSGFDDSTWASGAAELGYGDGDEATVVSYGSSSTNKYITTYFRRTFNVADPALVQALTLQLLRDDGAIVYLNGTEVFRSNMPGGTASYTTVASSDVKNAAESSWFNTAVDPALLLSGTNTLAVEIHQYSKSNADVSFNLKLDATANVFPGATKFFVADAGADKTFHYSAAGASINSSSLAAANSEPRGAVSDVAGDQVWVIDSNKSVYVYNANGSLLGSWSDATLQDPQGIAIDGNDLLVVDKGSMQVLRYAGAALQSSGTATAGTSFSLDVANASPSDLITDGTTVWVTDDTAGAVFVYDINGALLGQWSLDPANSEPSGITLTPGGNDLWVADRNRTVYHYAEAVAWLTGSHTATDHFALAMADIQPEGIADPPAGNGNVPGSLPAGVDYVVPGAGDFADVTSAFSFDYGRTSFNEQNDQLYAGLTIQQQDTNAFLRGRLLLAVTDISQPGIVLAGADGYTQDLTPFYDLTGKVHVDADGIITIDDSIVQDLAFVNPNGVQFDYTLKVLSQANTAPYFTSDPYAKEQDQAYVTDVLAVDGAITGHRLEIVAKNENQLRYVLSGIDPESDAVSFSILSGPADMLIDTSGTPTLVWTPTVAEAGMHTVRLRITDEHGLFDPANDQVVMINVLAAAPNRAPRFTTDPVVFAYAGHPYNGTGYDADAFDADGDTLLFGYVPDIDPAKNPGGDFTVDAATGNVTWTPAADQVGKTYHIHLTVGDQQSPELTDDQVYDLVVLDSPDGVQPGPVDLTVSDVNGDGLTYQPQQLTVDGVVTAKVTNLGTGSVSQPFDVLFFEDLDFTGTYTPAQDHILGTAHIDQVVPASGSLNVAATLAGGVTFAGAHVWAFVDSGDVIAETNENNNADRTERDCKVAPVVGGFDPHVEWSLTSFPTMPVYNQIMMTPAVIDLDGDEIPDIVFNTQSSDGDTSPLRAVRGSDGSLLWTTEPADFVTGGGAVAVGNIDSDPEPEIIATTGGAYSSDSHIIAFEHDGTRKWISPSLGNMGFGAPSLADLDHDGTPEIVIGDVVLNSDGTVRWNKGGSGGTGLNIWGALSVVADLDLDGSPEIIAGRTAYHADGTVYWNANVSDGFTAIANFDTDPNPEIVLVSQGRVYLLQHDGTLAWNGQGTAIPGGGSGGAPTIADFDGDGQPEIGVAGASRYVVFETDGTVKWQSPTQDSSSHATGSSVFDFEGDGKAEVVYADEVYLRIYDGTAGDVLYQLAKSSGTALEYPVIADVDADGNAEIVAVANTMGGYGPQNGLYVIGDRNDTWVPTRQIWNQHSYHITNVGDDGTIPAVEQNSWQLNNSYRLNALTTVGSSAMDAPDFIPSFVRVQLGNGQTTYMARVGNNGNLFAAAGLKVAFYDGDPNAGGTLLGIAATAGRLDAGHFEDVMLTIAGSPAADLWVVADDDGTGKGRDRECDEGNNAYRLATGTAPLTPNAPPAFTSTPVDHAVDGQDYAYDVDATDANGNTLLYELVAKPAGMTIDPTTGQIAWRPTFRDVGQVQVIVRVNDGRGGTTVQPYTLIVTSPNAAPQITSMPLRLAAVNHGYQYQVTADDANGDQLLYTIDDAAYRNGFRIDVLTGLLTWTPTAIGTFPITVTVSDGRGGTDAQRFELSVVSVNTPPHITTKPAGPIFAGQQWTYAAAATDFEDPTSALRFSLDDTARKLGMSVDAMTGVVMWTPATTGTFTAVLTVTDTDGAWESQTLTLPVEQAPPLNRPANITNTPTGPAFVDRAWQYLVQANDPDADPITLSVTKFVDANGNTVTPAAGDYSITQLPAAGQMLIRWTPRSDIAGPVHFEVTATDDQGAGETRSFDLPVIANSPPVILRAVSQAYGRVGVADTYAFDLIDFNGDALSIALVPNVMGSGTFDTPDVAAASTDPNNPTTVTLTYTPNAEGEQDLTVRVTDAFGAVATHVLKLVVQPETSTAPVASLTARIVIAAGQPFSAQVDASDPDNDPLTYTLILPGDPLAATLGLAFSAGAVVPAGMRIDQYSGLISWTPTSEQITPTEGADYEYAVAVSDGTETVMVGPATLRVVSRLSNSAPAITSSADGIRASGGSPLVYEPTAIDPDNDPLIWSLVSGPATATIDPHTGRFTWNPGVDEFGRDETARIQVTDPYGAGSYQDILLKGEESFVPANSPPRITSTPPLPGNGGETWTYIVRATDPEGNRIVFSLHPYGQPEVNGVSGLSITQLDKTSARISWTNPSANDSRDFVVLATDERGATGGQRVVLTIGGSTGQGGTVDTPPAITSTPAYSVMIGDPYTYQVAAEDPDQTASGAITYAVDDGQDNSIAWLSIDSNGLLTGDTTGLAPGAYIVRVIATQNGVSAWQRYTLTAADPATNNPPVIQPVAGVLTAVPIQAFTYQVVASDPEGQPLSYYLVADNGNLVQESNGFAIDASGKVTWNVPADATASTFTVRTVDSDGAYAERTFPIDIGADQPPTVSLRPSTNTPEAGSNLGFFVSGWDDVKLTDLHLVLTGLSTGTVTLPVTLSGVVTYRLPASVAGQPFTVTATATDSAGHSVSASLQLTVASSDSAAPQVGFYAIGNGAVIDKAFGLQGWVTDTDADLVYYAITAKPANGGPDLVLASQGTRDGSTVILGVGSSSSPGQLTTINPLNLPNGAYTFTLYAEDALGKSASTSFYATVQTQSKVGNFAMSFTDLTTTVAGVPITITRTYDSAKADQNGDFGFGWSLAKNESRVSVDLPSGPDPLLGDGWARAYEYGTRITLTMPDGTQRGFTTVLIPDMDSGGSFFGLADIYLVAFMPDADSRDMRLDFTGGQNKPLIVSPDSGLPMDLGLPQALTENGFNTLQVHYDENTGELADASGLPFNPVNAGWDFRVETIDGTFLTYSAETGQLLSQSDRVGNRTEYSGNGDTITAKSSTGEVLAQVAIQRDSQGRVDSITWNDGDSTTVDVVSYSYDSNGDLHTFTNRESAVVEYAYNQNFVETDPGSGIWNVSGTIDRPHFLTSVTDVERNIQTLRTVFDNNPASPTYGMLKKLVDGTGASAGIGYNVSLGGGLTAEVVADAYDNVTETVRDARGNAVRQIQQTGVSTYLVVVTEYDALDNVTGVSKPHEVNAAQKYTWMPGTGDWASRTVYGDPVHPSLPTAVTDGAGKTSTYEYDSRGNPTWVTDALGRQSIIKYDGDGQVTETVDAAGNVTTYGYENGNLTTLVMKKPDGTTIPVATNHFNVVGMMDSTTDATGRTISIEYDDRGRQTATSFLGKDGKVIRSETEYDNEGRITGIRQLIDGDVVGSTDLDLANGGRVLTTTDPFGRVTTLRYDARDKVVEQRTPTKDENGVDRVLVTRTAFDKNGRAIAAIDPFIEGVTPTVDYRVTHTIYDAAGRVIETRRVKGVAITLTQTNGSGTPGNANDDVFAAAFSYDPATDTYGGTPASSVVMSSTQTHYDNQGRVDYTTSETGLVATNEYDAAGRVERTYFNLDLDGDGTAELHETKYAYDAAGRQTRVTDTAGRVTEFIYDTFDRVVQTTSYGFVAAGVTPGSLSDDTFDDVVTQSTYDYLGRETATVDALQRRTDYVYDSAGRLTTVKLPAVLDADPLSPTFNQSVRPTYSYEYDAQGDRTAVVDARGNRTEFTYDNGGKQLTRVLPVGVATTGTATDFVETTAYDTSTGPANGQVIHTVDFEGRVTAYDYDNSATGGGRVDAVKHYDDMADYTANNPARIVNYTYDAFGRQVQADDSAFSAATAYEYDADGRLTKIASPQGDLHYAYDDLGRKAATWTGTGSDLAAARTSATTLTEYEYDKLNRLTKATAVRRFGADVDVDSSVSGIQPEVTETVYGRDGQVDYELLAVKGGDVTKDFDYDTQGRPTKVQHFADADGDHKYDSGEILLAGSVYTYTKDGTRASEVATDEAGHVTTTSWTYDADGRLASETFDGYDGTGNALNYTDTFAYDRSGNRVKTTHDDRTTSGTGSAGADSVTASTYDANDRLQTEVKDVGGTGNTADDRYTEYEYGGASDPGTDQTKKTVRQGLTPGGTVDETTTYGYDVTDRMTGVSVTDESGTTSVSYAYDANGFRVERTEGGVRTVYHIDPANPTGYSQVIEEGTDADNDHKLDADEVAKAYTLGLDVLTQATATQVLRLLADVHGSTRAAIDVASGTVAGAVAQRFAYNANGLDLGLSSPVTAVRYAGEMIDPVSGLSFNRARWYDPASGRWKQLDPWGGDGRDPITLNKYLYGNGNPISNVDPTGNFSLTELMVVAGGGESLDKLQTAYKTEKTNATQAKFLVSVALIQMAMMTWSIDEISGIERGFQALYYAYEIIRFQERVKKTTEELKLVASMPTLLSYLAALPGGLSNIDQADQLGAAAYGPLQFLTQKGKVHHVHFIPLTGNRRNDNYLTWAVHLGFSFSSIITAMETGGTASWVVDAVSAADLIVAKSGLQPFAPGYGTVPTLTWHHNEILGVMELVNSNVNHGAGAQDHVGSPVFWQILTGEPYK